jgi:site-specific DNA-cytosine methylase
MAERPLYTLYKNLKAQNYDVPNDYDKFESALTRDGKSGADNRHAIYENLKAQNFDVPDTYERFYSALFEPRSKTSSRAKGGSVPMSAADRARFSAGAAAISASAQQTMNNVGRYNRLKQRKQKQQKDFGRVNLGTHKTAFGGDANNVVKDDFAYNPETGKAGAYVTSDNDNAYTQNEAEQKQAILDEQNNSYQQAVDTGEIPSVLDVRDKNGNYDLQENIGKNGTYLTEEGAQRQFDKKLADAYARKKEIEALIAEDNRQHGNPLLSYGASIGAGNGRTAQQSDYRNKLATSLSLVTEQIGALEAVKQYPTSSWGEDALKALDNTVFTAKTWDFGLTDFATMGQMERIKTKMDNNIPLSGSDNILLKSKLGADAAAALEDEKMGNIYRWTKIAGQSLPFMADFFLTGGYGGITKGISSGALKIAAKRGMGKVSAAILKNTGIVAGDIIGSYAMAGTEQAMKTGADIMQRHLGNLYQDEKGDYKFGTFDENGNLLHEGGESIGTALYKGLTSAMVENYTEKLFGHNYGIKKGAIAAMEKHGMDGTAQFFKNIGKSGWYTNSKKWMEKFGINGFGEEVMEEEIGIPLHALLDGDNNFSDLGDAKQQLDIIGGMAISVGSMYAMGAGSRPIKGIYNRAQYYRFRNKVNVADNDAQSLFGDNWADIKDKIDNATNEQMGGVLADILRQRDTMNKEQINAAVNYGVNLMKMRGYNIAKTAEMNAKEIANEPTTPEEQHQADIDNAYSEGHDADDADKHNIQLEQNDKANELAAMLHVTPEQLHDMADEDLEAMTGQNDKLDQAIYDYQVSTAKYQGVMDGAQDEVDMAAHQAAMETDNMTDLSRGTVRKATIKATGGLEDYEVYIISGNIATHDDGSIDVGNSDDMIIYYDPTTGRKEHADAMMFADLIEELPAADVKAQAINDAKENAIKKIAGIIDGTVEVGSQFSVTDADGTEHTYEVLADNGDGTAMITIDGSVPTELVKGENVQIPYSFADLQQMKDMEDQKRLETAKAEREQIEKERAAKQTQETEETQSSFDFNQILNDDGNVVLVDVLDEDGNTKYPNSKLFLIRDTGAKAKVVELKSDGTIVPHAVNKEDVATISSMSLDEYKKAMPESSMIEDNSGENRGEIEVETPTIEGETAAPAEETAAPESAETPATEQTPAMTLEDGTEVPMLEDGNPDFSKLTAEQTAELYDSQFGEDADGIVSGYVSDAKKALDKANNMTVKGKNFVEQKAAKQAKEKAIADAQAAYDSAVAIRDAYNERQLAKVEDTADGRKNLIEKARRRFSRLKSAVKDDAEAVAQIYKETVGSLLHRLYDGTGIDVTDTIPLTAEEYVASNLGAHSINYEGTETSKGVKQETGLSREDFAKTQLLAADGKGTTIDNLVHSLWENRPSNLDSLNTQDIRNALIGVLTSGFKASEARSYVENIRIAQAEKLIEEERTAAENATYYEQQKAKEEEEKKKAELEKKAEEENKKAKEEKTEDNEQTKFPDKLKEGSKAIEAPGDATDEKPFGEQLDEANLPFSAKENGKQQTTSERAADVEKNKVDDMKVVDNIVGQKTRKAFDRLAKMMGANIQWQYSDKLGNGWIQETKDADGNVHRTIFITLDSSITEGAQFIFGHEMTHQIKNLNPAAYNELTQLVLDTYGSDAFDKAVNETMQRYSDAGFSGRNRDYYAEEVVADAVGEMIRDLNLAHTLAMKMSHPLLAAIHEILQKIKLAFFGTEYSDVTKNIIRSIEQAYVKTANGEVTNSETGEDVSFSLRQKPEPKKKGVGYKVFVLKDGKLYPPMVANPDGAATPVGVWLDADAAPIAGESKTGRPQVKQGGKGTQGGSGKLAYRPGWHLGVVPYAIQFNRKDAEGNKTLFPKNFVFAEVEYAADVDYQEEARQEGINPSGKYQHSLAGLKHLPTDGYYMYRTNPNPETDPWVITGAMKVNRILTRAEQAELVKNAGREPQQIQEGDIVTDDVVNSINQEIADAPKFSLKVYHGSGSDFTDFDFDHMGDGAGSQVFGWGGYVTSSKKIGKSYATLMDNDPSKAYFRIQRSNGTRFAKKYPTLESFLHGDKQIAMNDKFTEQEKIDYYNEMKKLAEPYHNLYEVDIPDDNGSNYLDWDKPLSKKQQDSIREGLEHLGVGIKTLESKGQSLERTGENVYNSTLYIGLTGTEYDLPEKTKGISKFLSSVGFTGIKYKAGRNFGGAKKGDTNYVIFEPEDMKITEHTKFSIKTYHGSQSSFDHFDHSFMGSGEGAQAYGWGTYVTEVEGIAKAYAKQNAAKRNTEYSSAKFEYDTAKSSCNFAKGTYDFRMQDIDKLNNTLKWAKEQLVKAKESNRKNWIDEFEARVADTERALKENQDKLQDEKAEMGKAKKEMDEAKKRLDAIPEPERNLYTVEIPDDTGSNYIEWDGKAPDGLKEKVLDRLYNERREDFVDKMRKAGFNDDQIKEEADYTVNKEEMADTYLKHSATGGGLYRDLSYYLGEQKKASLFLKDMGIDGVKVIAKRNAGGNKEGKMNYVIFDENNAQIISHTKFSLRLKSAIDETETNPSDAQKESGNYKKGHIKFGGYDYTIENPKGSTRSGKDANGKEWKVTMHDTYGYIRGKFGKDGDHLDMFINDKADLDNWNGDVFVVDQVNPDGSFDEHKVMYGYDSMDDAKKSYLANYSDGWQGLGNITGVSKDEFDKWLDTSNRKLKPFADYAKVKFSFKDIKPVGVGAFGNIYNQFRGNAKAAIEFLKKVRGGEAVGALHHKDIGDIDLVWGKEGTGHSDGYGLSKLVKYHPEVLDNLQEILNDMRVVSSSKNRVNLESETHKAGVRLTWDGERKSWLLTAFKKETSASDKRTDTVATSLEGDTALSQTEGSAAKIDNSSETAKENGEKFSLKDDEYLKAVENGDMEKAQKMVNEAAEAAGYSTDSSYQGTSAFNGSAPWGNGYFLTKEERKEAWDNEEYDGDQTLGDYIHRGIDAMNLDFIALDPRNYRAADPMRKEAIDNVRNAIQKKSETITMYRSVPSDVKEGSFRNGDWVTPSRAYAVDNAKVHGWGDNFNIIEQKVPVDEIWWDGNDIAEWGYGREEDYVNDTDFAYKNTKNNRKLLDAVTYDDNGNVIPLSQRFNENNADVRYSLKDEKTMFGMHNISLDKLRKAIKQGGFAAPSMGVTDSKNGIYSGYGEITLIPKAEKIAKRTGKNIGTYAADAWTPIYPPVEKKFGGNGGDVAYDDIESVPKEMQSLTRNAINSFMDGRDTNSLAYLYLHEKGKAPELVHVEGKYPKELHDEVKGILGKLDSIYSTTDEQKEKLLDLFIREVYDGNREEFDNDIKNFIKKDEEFIKKRPNSNIAKNKQLDVDWMKEHGYDYGALSRFVDGILRDAETSGKVDENATMKAAQQYIQDNGMKEDFDSWKEKLNDRYNVEEVIFAGYKADGNRKYLPNTVENAVKVMKQDGKNASVGSASFSHFVASILKPMGTLDQIRKKKGNLTDNYEDVEKFQEKWQPVYDELADKMQPDAGPFESYGMDRLEDAATQKNPKKYAKDEYGVDLTDEDIDKLNELIDAVKNEKPSIYFETKFMRPYGLDEFEKAIVPNDTPSDVVDALKMAGIDVSSYERGNAEDRQKVTMDAINSSDNIRFSLAGERGAAAADKAEERTARMDNLSVARKMEEEKKDAKAIKMATGWERGADGKWRYEMPDVVLRDPKEWVNKKTLTLSDIVEKPNDLFKEYPELFDAYPELKDMKILKGRAKSGGVFYNNAITLNLGDIREAIKYDMDTHYKLANNSLKKTLVHEIQHYIQDKEGFAQGGNSEMIIDKNALDAIAKLRAEKDAVAKEFYAMSPEEQQRRKYEINNRYNDLTKQIERLEKSSRIGYDGYNRLSGEVEARNVSARLNMTPEERRKSLAESTEDVARKDQIFLGVGDVSFSLRDMADGKESGAADMAEDLKSLNTPDEVDDAIKTAIDDMPSGWKMANKKMIHIAQALGENRKAEIAGEEPKFSLKDGSLIKAGTYFSGGGLVEEGLKGIIDPVVAVEYDEKISGVYRNNFGQHIVTADVRDVDPKELVKQIDGEVEYFHASPVCKNYSQAKSNHAEVELDKETAASTAEFINAVKPKVVTIENVKGYKDSEAMKIITDALDADGYTWDADVYNAADFGGYTNRERLIVRAVRDGQLPAKPKKMERKSGWYEAVADIIPTLTEKKNGVAPWMDIRLKADGIDWRNIDKPLYVMGSAYADGKIPHAFADELLPTLRTKSGDVIVMPDGKVYRAMGRVLARVSGVSDDYKMPFSENLSHTIIGNGIPTQLTEHVIAPLLQNTLRPTTPEDGNTKFSLRYDQFEHDLNQWKKDNNLPKDAQRPTIPQRNAGESSVDFLRRVDEYRKQMALWKTAPTYEQHLLSDDTALGEFNRELQCGSVLKRIAFQDSMLAIRKAQEAIMKEVGVDRLNMAEDAYTAENRSHGKGKNEFEEYNNEFLQPLRKAYHQMKKVLGDSYDNVRIYMMAKHGLERDAQMAFKKSLEAGYEDVAQRSAAYKAYKGDMNRIINDSDLEYGRVDFNTWRQRDNALRTKYSPSYMNYRYDKMGIAYDYSGLSALFDGSDFEETAHKLIKDIESKYVTETHNLWDATNAATKKILRDGYKAGMMSKDTYQYVRDMYSHYIPLRGWDGTTADQVWDYIGGGKGAFNQTLKKAHGRTSIADDPIAYIENMAESGILLNNKNWVKQHLMLLAQNHPTSLLTLSKAWYVKSVDDNGNEEWIPATPQITSQMDSNQVKAAIDAFEKKMEQMAQTGNATQKRDGLNIAYPQTHSEEREHEVRVMKDGEEYVIYVNGDPQLAQAMNNTRAHRVREIQSGKLDRAAAWLGRKMAAAYTSLSPLFIPSNYFRDLTMTLASTAIREDAKYNYLLRKNLATSWNLGFMLKDYQNGKLREKVSNGNATPKEQMFYDFMMNGGETGFVSSLDVEDLKKKFKNDLKDLDRWKANPVKVGHTIMDVIEFLNRMIEDSNRFAIYMTSIQYGRSIDEAVNDAKDVTLNFNRKGTGEYGWQMIRNLYLFINPAVQSLQTLGALGKHHPFKFMAVTASWIASGVLVPIVNAALMQIAAAFGGGDGDDKKWYKDISKKYWQFTKWDRRNNLIMWFPFTHEFIKIPLAQEFRAFYGVGDMIASNMMGGKLAEESWSQYAEDLLGQVVDMLPLDPTGYDGNIAVSLMPNAVRPIFELAFNVDFTGKPLFKETEYNKYDPNFTKAYVGTPDWLVRASRMMNSIGNDYPDVQQNKWDALGNPRYNLNNPAVVDHVLSSYLGGAYTMGSQVLGVLTKSLNDPKEIKVADIPLFSKFVSNPDDRPASKKQGDEFWDKKEYYDRASNTISKLKKQAKIDGDYSLLERFYGSEEYKTYKLYEKDVKDYKETRKKERAEESGDEYKPHQINAEDIYNNHTTSMDEFEDMKLKQLFEKLNSFKNRYDAIVDNAPNESDGYYNTNKAAIDAIDEISLDKQEISELKKGFLDDGKDAYNAEDMKQIRELRKKILSVLEKANKVVVANQKAKAKKK